MNEASMTFEASMNRLEQIVQALEKGSVPLADALKLFQEGTGLVGRCTQLLDQAELEVRTFTTQTAGQEGETDELPF